MLEGCRIEIIPIGVKARFSPFDLTREVSTAIAESGERLRDGDILVISSKFAAISEGGMIDLSTVKVSQDAIKLGRDYGIEPAFAQLVLEKSGSIIGGIKGFVLSVVSGTLAPNAGYDRSNVPKGYVIQYPEEPFKTADRLRKRLIETEDFANAKEPNAVKKLGVVLSDSRVTPTRLGTVGIAVSYAGIKPTIDMRGTPDLLGNNLVVTLRAVADQIATAAQLVMGESNEGRPIAIVRGFNEAFGDSRNEFERSSTIPPEKCLILSSLANSR
jgi:coenzyme F420-0:L-glutamate ligase / coenzyme F420-1:gamma-L-glutamate ligase